jgi:acyl-CoA synthetase (NDP forming)
MTTAASSLSTLFAPTSIAIVGASASPNKIGAVPLGLLKRFGYRGALYPVNPGAKEIQGERCYPRLSDIGAPIDMAIFAVPVARAEEAFLDAVSAGVKSVVLFTSGFSETGPEGHAIQTRLTALSRANGMRMLGPNCLGYMNVRDNVYATFSPAPGAGIAPAGAISIVSQSGAFGAYAYSLARNRGLGLSYWVTTGNQADVDVADCIEFLIDDDATRVIMLYMEGSSDGAKLRRALERARAAQKPVVVTKVGRTSAGARAAMSHTAALAGDDAAYEALFRQCGALRAHSIDDFFNLGYALSMCRHRPTERSLGVITISGGVGALIADDAETLGMQLPQLPAAVQQQILALVPFAAPANPVDITGQATADGALLGTVAELMMAQPNFGSLLVFLAAAGGSDALWPHFEHFAEQFTAKHPATPLVLCSLFSASRREALEQRGVLVYDDPSAAVRSLAAICKPSSIAACGAAPSEAVARPLVLPKGSVSEAMALHVLAGAGVPVMPHLVAHTKQDAIAAAERLGYPVVLKISSADILHKSDIGGVRLNLNSSSEVASAFDQVMAAARQHAPQAHLDGVLVAAMISGGVECIVGVKRDPTLGALVMFGLGGVDVELYRDVSFRLAPFDRSEALAMIVEVRASALLRGHRGRPLADIDALANVLVALAASAALTEDLESIDINPLAVLPEGQGVLALDALLVARVPS